MSFRPATALADGRTLRFSPLDGSGLEEAEVRCDGDVVTVRSHVRGERDGQRFDLRYTLACSAGFETLSLTIEHADGRNLALRRKAGGWTDSAGRRLDGFGDCTDPDLAWSPLTNTLPIRRLDWQAGQSRRLAMLYLPLDGSAPRREEQVYTCLEPRRFRFETADGSFSSVIAVDENGYVTDYPALFERLGHAER